MTLGEYNELLDAYHFRQEIDMQKIAWHAANTMNVHLKKKVTMKQLLGQEKTTSREQRVAQFEELKKRLERQKAE